MHLFEWSWADIAQECEDWLGPKGFNAVQISPPNEHIQGSQWWTRYQPVTYKLVSRSGDEAAFTDMVQRCKKAGVGIYADAVLNHIAAGSGTGVAGGQYGGRSTPIYQKQDMHYTSSDMNTNCGVTNYQDKHNVQYCDLVSLPDLCTSCQKVKELTSDYINRMADIGIAGFRIDAAKHMDAGELGQLLRRENLYSNQLRDWRKQLKHGGEAALSKSSPGPKASRSPEQKRIEQLEKELTRTQRKLRITEDCVGLQKKALSMLDQSNNGNEPL